MNQLIYIVLGVLMSCPLLAQSTMAQGGMAWGAKGGFTIATQRWNGADAQQALPSYHGAAFVEWLGAWKGRDSIRQKRSSFGLELGYHRKGNGVRVQYINANGNNVRTLLTNEFHNVSLVLFGKGNYRTGRNTEVYYTLGIRADYTAKFSILATSYAPYVNSFNYGATLGGGYVYQFNNSPIALFIEASISPDISRQIYVPAGIPTVYQVNGSTYQYPSTEQKVNNLIGEISVGIKFLPRPTENLPIDEESF